MRVSVRQFTIEPGSVTSSREEVTPLGLSPEPVAEPPVPANTPVQDILFKPPGLSGTVDKRAKKDPGVVLSFDMSDPHAAIRMQRAVRDVYALYGEAGWSPLIDAIAGVPMREWKLQGEPSLATGPYLSYEAPQRSKLRRHFFEERRRLEGVLATARSEVEQTAVKVARERLKESREQLLREAKRYLDVGDKSDRSAAAALETSATWKLAGPDVIPLATAVLRIDEARKPVRLAEEVYEREARSVREKRMDYFSDQQARVYPESITPQDIVDLLDEAERAFPDTPKMVKARQDIAEREAELAAFVAAEAIHLPILYRLWNIPLAGAIRKALAEHRPTNDVQARRALNSSSDFREAVLDALRTTWAASGNSLRRIEKRDLVVWRYPPLIAEALRRLAVPPGTVERRAADEQLREQQGAVSPWTVMSTVSGFFEIGFVLAGAAAPVAAAAAAIGLVLSAAEWVEEASRTLEQQDAFDSSLDPSRSFATEPSYVGLIVGLAFLGLSAVDVAGAGKALRALDPAVTTP